MNNYVEQLFNKELSYPGGEKLKPFVCEWFTARRKVMCFIVSRFKKMTNEE